MAFCLIETLVLRYWLNKKVFLEILLKFKLHHYICTRITQKASLLPKSKFYNLFITTTFKIKGNNAVCPA